MAYKTQLNQSATITPVEGQRKSSRLLNKRQTLYVGLLFSAAVTITAAFATLLNRGSVLALYDFIALSDAGKDDWILDGPSLRFLDELLAPSRLSATRLAGVGIQGPTTITEAARLWFAWPLAASPFETTYRERDDKDELTLDVQLHQDGGGGITQLATGGGGAGSVAGHSVSVVQSMDGLSTTKPYFIPVIRQLTFNVSGANPQFEMLLKSSNIIRAIIVKQETNLGEVGDIITSLAFRSDVRDIIGPNQVSWQQLTRGSEFDHGGDVFDTGTGFGANAYWGKNFQESGRLANCLNAALEPNLRLEGTVAPSGQAGVTASRIRVTLVELVRSQGFEQLVAPSVPFPV